MFNFSFVDNNPKIMNENRLQRELRGTAGLASYVKYMSFCLNGMSIYAKHTSCNLHHGSCTCRMSRLNLLKRYARRRCILKCVAKYPEIQSRFEDAVKPQNKLTYLRQGLYYMNYRKRDMLPLVGITNPYSRCSK